MAHITLSQLTTVLQRIVSWATGKFAAKNTYSGKLEYADMPVVVLASMGSELDGTSTQRPMSAGDTYYLPAGQGAGARIMFVDSIGTAVKISDPVSNVIYCNAYTGLLYRWDASESDMVSVGGDGDGLRKVYVRTNDFSSLDALNSAEASGVYQVIGQSSQKIIGILVVSSDNTPFIVTQWLFSALVLSDEFSGSLTGEQYANGRAHIIHRFYNASNSSSDIPLNTWSEWKVYGLTLDEMSEFLNDKQDTLTFDSAPTANSNNPVKSGGVYTALANKQDTIADLASIRTGAGKGATAIQGIIVGNVEVTPDANKKVTIPAGADGKSAYQSYLDTTSDNPKMSEAEWVASLKGKKGDAGNVHVTDGVADIDIINDLSTGGVGDALSAEMGLRLKANIDAVQANIVKLYAKLANMAFWDSTDHGDAEPTALDWSIPKVTATITNSIGANAVIKKNGSVVGSSVQVDQGSPLVLTIEAATGYELSNVAATIGGVAQTLTENNGVYTLSIDHVNSSITIAITGSASMLWHTMAKTNVEDGNGNVVEYGIQQGRSINPTTLDVTAGLSGSTPLVVLAPLANPTDQYIMTTNTNLTGPGNAEPYFIPTFGKRYLHFKMSGGTFGQVPKICIACYKESIVDGFSYSQANVQSRGITRIPYQAANNGDMQWKVDLFDAVNNPTGGSAGSPVAGDIKFVKVMICVYPNGTSTKCLDSRTWFDNFSFAYKITDD